MSTILRYLFAVLAILRVASAAPAAVLFSETFSYPDGHLASDPPDGGVSGGLWNEIPQSFAVFPRVDVSIGKITLHHNPGSGHTGGPRGEDVERGFSALAAGQTIYAGFDVSASYDGYYGYYQAHLAKFAPPYCFSCGATLRINSLSGSDFTFGIGTVSWASGLTFNTTYRVVMSYEFDTGSSKLWVNPVNQSSTNISAAGSASYPVSAFALWQDSSQTPNTQVLDNLVVGTTFDEVLAIPGPTLPGDYDGDGDVDGGDFLSWQQGLGSSVTPSGSGADGDHSGVVDAGDLAVWRDNFGATLGSGSTDAAIGSAVPEPATALLVAIGLAAVGAFGRRRRNGSRA